MRKVNELIRDLLEAVKDGPDAVTADLLTDAASALKKLMWQYEDERPMILLTRDEDDDVIARDLFRPGCTVHGDTIEEALGRLSEAREAWDALAKPVAGEPPQ